MKNKRRVYHNELPYCQLSELSNNQWLDLECVGICIRLSCFDYMLLYETSPVTLQLSDIYEMGIKVTFEDMDQQLHV